jgi:hypothetical protein
MRALVLVMIACACPSKPEATGPGSGSGTGSGSAPVTGAGCDGARAHVDELYKAEITRADLVADNVAMVMKDCSKQPDRVAGCAANAKSVAELEKTCLIPLDPEGTEGLELKK